MEHKETVPLLEANLARQLQWITAADTKAAFVFTLTTAMLGLLAAVAPDTVKDWGLAPAIATAVVVCCSLAVFAFVCLCAFPRTSGPYGSMVYCGEICRRTEAEFRAEVVGLSHESYAADLAAQCHRNAAIASEKFSWVKRAMIAMFIAVIPWILSIWWLYSAASGSGNADVTP